MRSSNPRHGFTLIELLVVIGVIAILAAILMPVIRGAFAKTDTVRAKNTCLEVRKSVDLYLATYGRLPVAAAQQGGSQDIEYKDTQAQDIIVTLSAVDKAKAKNFNPKLIAFLDAPTIGQNGELLDPWDKQFALILDTNFDGEIEFPKGSGNKYRAKSVVYSYGPNQKADTNPNDKSYDDVSSATSK